MKHLSIVFFISLVAGLGAMYSFQSGVETINISEESAYSAKNINQKPSGEKAERNTGKDIKADVAGRTVGLVSTYDLSLDNNLKSNSSEKFYLFELAGKLILQDRIIDHTGVKVLAKIQVESAIASDDKNNIISLEDKARIENELNKPFAFHTNKTGAVDKIYMDQDIDPFAAGIQKALISAIQFVKPTESDIPNSWVVEESSVQGVYLAEYRRKDSRNYTKSKLKYIKMPFFQGEEIDSKITDINSLFSITVSENGILKQLSGSDSAVTKAYSNEFSNTTNLSLELKNQQVLSDPIVVAANLVEMSLLDIIQTATETAPLDPAKFRNVKELLSVLNELKSGEDGSKRWALMREMTKKFLADPASLEAAKSSLYNDQLSEEDAAWLFGAIGDADSEAAQAVLVDIATDASLSDNQRLTAVTHLGFSASPTPENISGLQQLVDDPQLPEDLKSSALMALGNAIREKSELNGAIKDNLTEQEIDTVVSELVKRYDSAPTDRDKYTALSAIGNSGNDGAIAPVFDALRSENEDLRAAAVSSMRFMTGDDIDEHLLKSMLSDSSEQVRQSAIQAFSYRELNLEAKKALVQLAETEDGSLSTRLEAVDAMGRRAEQDDDFRNYITKASQGDPNEEIRQLASKWADQLTQ